MKAPPLTAAELRDLRIHLETLEEFDDLQDLIDDTAGLCPSEDCVEGMSIDAAQSMWATYRQERRSRGDAGRRRSGKRKAPRRRRRVAKRTVKLVCSICRYDFFVRRSANDKRIRRWCSNACKCKWYRVQRIMRKLGDNLERARPAAAG